MIRIITDSASDFEPQELLQKQICCVPMSVSFEETEYIDGVNLSKELFYKLLTNSSEIPHTSQPSPDSFIQELEPAIKSGDDVILITVSSALSGTYQSAMLAKNMLGFENCYIIDSLSASAGQRLLVEHAAKLRDKGLSASDIAAELENLRSKLTVYACIDTLEYLHKGGRISGLSYTVGSVTNIKPVVRITKDGKIEIVSKVIGRKKAVRTVCDMLKKAPADMDYPRYILYTHNKDNALLLAEKLKMNEYDVVDENVINIGATIGTHIGPNAFGVAYIEK